MSAHELSALPVPLDRELLHVFVAGPGYGEGIAVAMPGTGWLLLDGCQVGRERRPLLAILERWRDPSDPVDAMLLTHPHKDHAFGIRETLETTLPRRVGLTTSVSKPELVFRAAEAALSSAGPLERQRRRVVLDAMLAIKRRFVATPGELIPLVDGARVPLTASTVDALVRAPDAALVHERLDGGAMGDPNELSAVIEVVFGTTRIVLGSDLPTVDSRGAPLVAGWNTVMTRHEHLGQHHGLKIPHHGSPAAFHEDLMTAATPRIWWISPFNQGKRLPPAGPNGIPRLVALNGQVSLTGTPHPRSQQAIHEDPGLVALADLPALFAPKHPLVPGAMSVTPPDVEPLDPLWCAAFDDRGNLRGSWRGSRAYTVVP